jgi:hypothetical protein
MLQVGATGIDRLYLCGTNVTEYVFKSWFGEHELEFLTGETFIKHG